MVIGLFAEHEVDGVILEADPLGFSARIAAERKAPRLRRARNAASEREVAVTSRAPACSRKYASAPESPIVIQDADG